MRGILRGLTMNDIKKKSKEVFTIPNLLSIFRIVVILPFLNYFLNDEYIMAAFMLIISGATDMFDGAIARKFNQVTRLGAMLDPIADKLTLAIVVICVGIKFKVVMPFVIILVLKEALMLLAGVFLIIKHKTPPSSKWFGKVATVVFYISFSIIIILKSVFAFENAVLIVTLMSITVGFMMFALIKYFILFIDILNDESSAKIKSTVTKLDN